MRWWRTIEDQLRQGGVRVRPQRPDPPTVDINGNEEAIEIQRRTREAIRSCREALYNRAIDGCAQRDQHDCRRRDVGISAALPLDGEALLVSFWLMHELMCRGRG